LIRVNDVMSKHVEVIDAAATVREAAKKMRDLDSGALPVGENDRLIGMVTDRDIAVNSTAEGHDASSTQARDIMHPRVVYCFDDQEPAEAAETRKKHKIRCTVAVNRDKRLAGICWLGDLVSEGEAKDIASEVCVNVAQTH